MTRLMALFPASPISKAVLCLVNIVCQFLAVQHRMQYLPLRLLLEIPQNLIDLAVQILAVADLSGRHEPIASSSTVNGARERTMVDSCEM